MRLDTKQRCINAAALLGFANQNRNVFSKTKI